MSDNFEFAEKLAKAAANFQGEFAEAGNGLSLVERQLQNLCIQVAEDAVFAEGSKLHTLLSFSKVYNLIGNSLVKTVQHLTGRIAYEIFEIHRPWSYAKTTEGKMLLIERDYIVEKAELKQRSRILKKIGIKEFSNVKKFLRALAEGVGDETTSS